MKKYVIGCDFGSLSARAILAECDSGKILSDDKKDYAHAVISGSFIDGRKLEPTWALQDPKDYLDALGSIVPQVIKKSGVAKDDIIGIGIDFTSASVLPVNKEGIPLCFLQQFQNEPNAYVKMWKHHVSEQETMRIHRVIKKRDPMRLEEGLGIVSAESQLAKVLETLYNSPDVYMAADRFMEAGDWLTFQLCGNFSQSVCYAGFKGIYSTQLGWISYEILEEIDPRLSNYRSQKWNYPVYQMGDCVGNVTRKAADWLGLTEKCKVSVAVIDGHAAVPACGIDSDQVMTMIIGTGSTHTVLSKKLLKVSGICGVVKGAVYPDQYTYEAGQCCVGDHYQWISENLMPKDYFEEAEKEKISVLDLLTEKAAYIENRNSHLLALDWWNGNRSILMDSNLKGMILGLNLHTKVENIYLALIEANAMGAYRIHREYERAGFQINEIRATGGICQKNPFIMQVYADFLGKRIRLAGLQYGSALGSAMYASVAAGSAVGGFDNIHEAVEHMKDISDIIFEPCLQKQTYCRDLFEKYCYLYDLFGNEQSSIMHDLG